MRISSEREELVNMQFGHISYEIKRKHPKANSRTIFKLKGGNDVDTYRKALIEKLTDLCNAWIDICLAAFAKEGMVPNTDDLKEIEVKIDKIISSEREVVFVGRGGISDKDKSLLVWRVKQALRLKVKEMELERRHQSPQAEITNINTINIHGDNRGNVQQGGEGNTQTINRSNDETKH
jgi:hypothetical protein